MRQKDFTQLLEKFSNGQCSKEEEEFVLQWYENVKGSGQFTQKADQDKAIEEKVWKAIRPLAFYQQGRRLLLVKIAAAVAILTFSGLGLLLISGYFNNNTQLATNHSFGSETIEQITVTNSNHTPFTLKLMDGSEVTLQPRSEIRYPKIVEGQREVYLSGEAFFKVVHDTLHPFLVYSNEVVTRVLGTSFTVKAYKNESEITISVQSGKVSVYTLPKKGGASAGLTAEHALILRPNQKAVYQRDRQLVTKKLVEKPELILPVPTLFNMQYDGAPVVKIFTVLKENYGVDIVFDSEQLSDCMLTTSFTDEGLYERIEVICKAIGAQYEVTDAVILIKGGTGCK
jgi:transmembrane sensor